MDEKEKTQEKGSDYLKKGLFIAGAFIFLNALTCNGFYNDYKAPQIAMENATKYSKVGQSTAVDYFGVVRVGDSSFQTALTNGGVTKVHHVDTQYKGSIFKKEVTTYVYGE